MNFSLNSYSFFSFLQHVLTHVVFLMNFHCFVCPVYDYLKSFYDDVVVIMNLNYSLLILMMNNNQIVNPRNYDNHHQILINDAQHLNLHLRNMVQIDIFLGNYPMLVQKNYYALQFLFDFDLVLKILKIENKNIINLK